MIKPTPPRLWNALRRLTPVRIAVTGALLILVAAIVLWIAPADGYQLELVDTAHPVAALVHVKGERPKPANGTIYFVDVLAPYVALKLLGYDVSEQNAGVSILQVEKGAPAAKVLKPNDLILAVDGQPVKTITDLHGVLGTKHPGDRLTIRFRRGGTVRTATVTTAAAASDPKQAILGIFASDNLEVHLPVQVTIDSRGIGGPSAGLAFALEILQELGRNVAHGRKIAATGELGLDGRVLPIGGVKQKTLGARRAHVDAFLVPAGDNAREARRYADGLRIIPVENVQQALRVLATLAPKA